MPKINAGELRTPIDYQIKVPIDRGNSGQQKTQWVTQWSGFGLVRPLSMKEMFYAGGQTAQRNYRIFIRYRDNVTSTGRFVLKDGRSLYISSVVTPDERRVFLDITATEKGA